MNEKKNKLFLKIFVLAVCCMLAAKMIFDYDGFWSIFGKIGSTILDVLSYVLVGFIIAYVLEAFIQFLDTKLLKFWKNKGLKAKRALCIVLAYIVFAGIVALICIAIVPRITESLNELVKNAPTIYEKLSDIYGKLMEGSILDIPQSVLTKIDTNLRSLLDSLIAAVDASRVTSLVTSTAKVLANALLGIMVSVYMLAYKKQAVDACNHTLDCLFKPKTAIRLRWAGRKANDIFHRYFTGKILQAMIVITVSFIIFLIARVPYALLFAVVIGLFNMIPYIGPWVGAVPVILVSLSQGVWKGVIALVCVLAIQAIDNIFISPRVLGDSMGVNPLAILIGLCIGGQMFGIVGVLFGDVIAALAKVFIYDTLFETIRARRILKARKERKADIAATHAPAANVYEPEKVFTEQEKPKE